MEQDTQSDKPFPLKRYYLLYGGVGSLLFYVLLFLLFIHAERQALYDEYIHAVSEKAMGIYRDIERDFLKPHGIGIEEVDALGAETRASFRNEIEEILSMDFSLAKVKFFRADGMTLYDHKEPWNEGTLYTLRQEEAFQSALRGVVKSGIEVDTDGRRLMEAYLPITENGTAKVVAILEIYEDVSRFEAQVQNTLKAALVLPTLVYILFNIVLYLIVSKADRIIAEKTTILVSIRRNMEKYLSQSAVTAICRAVSEQKELFRGDRETVVVFFSDIRGFTSFSDRTEPEQVVQRLNALFEIQARIIHRHGGVIDKFVGDEVMVVFAAGLEGEAVHAAMEILEAISSQPEVGLAVGIGIHAGEAVVGSIGTEDRRDYTVIGDTVNVGARLCGACPGEGLYVSDVVFARLPADLQSLFGRPQTLALKGKAAPVNVYPFTLLQKS